MKVPAVIDRLIIPIYVVLVLALMYAIVQTVLFFVFGTGNDDADSKNQQVFDMPAKVSPDDIIDANLFGELPEESIEPVIEETTLNLRLVGISYNAGSPESSRAYIIGRSSASALRYSIGERVEGIAEVTDIFEDHVLLLRGGRKESLYVEQREQLISATEETTFKPAIPAQSEESITQSTIPKNTESDDGTSSTPRTWVRQYFETHREQLEETPDKVLEEIGITPVEHESAAGYRINATLAERLGLRTGDVLVSVNGFKIGNVQEDIAHFDDHLDAESLKLEVQRGETMLTINYKPSQ